MCAAASSPLLPIVYLYQGNQQFAGVSIESYKGIKRCLEKLSYSVQSVKADQLHFAQWHNRSILVLPGGVCSVWDQFIDKDKQKELAAWTESGGKVLAICAGGYFCALQSNYQSGSKSVIAKREVKLFAGACVGPFLKEGLQVVKIIWESTKTSGYVAVISGGQFINDKNEKENSSKTLAKYENGAVAVVNCMNNKGRSILSGPHWELDSTDLEDGLVSEAELKLYRDYLDQGAEFRKACIQEMLKVFDFA